MIGRCSAPTSLCWPRRVYGANQRHCGFAGRTWILRVGFLTVEGARKGTRTKSGKSRVVPLTRQLRAALSDHAATYRLAMYKRKRSEWLFHHERDLSAS